MKFPERTLKVFLGMAGFVSWLIVLVMGITVNSFLYREAIQRGALAFSNFVMVGLTYTPTNVAILSILSGLMGGAASNVAASNIRKHLDEQNIKLEPDSPDYIRLLYMRENPLVSALRGFVVYLIFVVSTYISITTESPTTIFSLGGEGVTDAPMLYYKFSLTVSLIAFLIGYDPTRLNTLIDAVPFFKGRTADKKGD
jgi:hypothetical protein